MDREWYSERITVNKTGGLFHFSGRAGMGGMIGTSTVAAKPGKARQRKREWLSRLSLARC